MNTEFTQYLPMLAKVQLKGNTSIYISFLVAALASAAPCVFLWKSLFQGQDKKQADKIWSSVVFLTGLFLVVVGLFVYWILGIYGKPAAIVHGVGVGMILAMLLVGTYEAEGLFKGQTAFFSGVTIFFIAAALALVVGVNYIGVKKSKEFDFNKGKLKSLDALTVNKLKSLKEPVEVLVFVTKEDSNVVPQIKDTLGKYEAINSKMFKVRYINPLNEPELASCYGVREGKGGKLRAQILVAKGECVNKPGKSGEQEFKGKKLNITQLSEEHITNRMIRVSRKQEKKLCFLRGRNQPSTKGKPDANGFHFLKKVVENKGFKTRDVNLLNENEVPSECTMLINAAPEMKTVAADSYATTARLSDQEIDKIERYLDNGGKMMLFLEPLVDTGLGPMLEKKFGIQWRAGLVLDFRKNVGRPEYFMVSTFDSRHQITKPFASKQDEEVRTYYWNATALKKVRNVAGANVANLAFTDQIKRQGIRVDRKTGKRSQVTLKCCTFYIPKPSGMRFRFLQREYIKVRPIYMAQKAIRGFVEQIIPDAERNTFSVAMAASKKSAKAGKETRILVFGDTFIATNRGIRFQGAGNYTLLLNSIGWLAREKDLIALPPKNRKLKKLALTSETRNLLMYTTRYAMPVFFFFMILLVSAIRRQK